MKAISVKQPWAGYIASGEKTIETRSWKTSFRGELLIVSSKHPKIEPAGFALAIVRMVDCRRMTQADEKAAMSVCLFNLYAWVFDSVTPIKPFRVNGKLRLYNVDVIGKIIHAKLKGISIP